MLQFDMFYQSDTLRLLHGAICSRTAEHSPLAQVAASPSPVDPLVAAPSAAVPWSAELPKEARPSEEEARSSEEEPFAELVLESATETAVSVVAQAFDQQPEVA